MIDPKKDNSYTNPTFVIGDDKFQQNEFDARDIELTVTKTQPVKEVEQNDPQNVDFNDMLPIIGEFGRYQKFLFALMIPFAFFLAFVYFTQIFLTLEPDEYWCEVPELENLTKAEKLALAIPRVDGEYSKCSMYDVNFTQQLLLGIREANESWPVKPCSHGHSYDFSVIPYTTIVTELNWVCIRAPFATYAQAIFFVGAIVGGLLFGWIADKYGRVPSLIACNLMGCIAGVATAFVTNFWQFALMRFFVGFAFDNCFIMIFILVLEYVGPSYRTLISNIPMAIFFCISSCGLPWMAYYIANWQLLAIVTSAPLILVIFTHWMIPESARWLVSQGKFDKSIEIMKKFAKTNGKSVKDETFEIFRSSCIRMQQEQQLLKHKNYTIMDMFRTPRMRRTSILYIIVFMVITLVFDGHVRSIGSLGYNVFITFSLASLTELPSGIALVFILDRLGRRWTAFGSLFFSGLFSLFAVASSNGIVTVAFAIVGRFFINISYNVGYQYAAELLPTVVRAQGVTFIIIMGFVATILAPFIVYLSTIWIKLPLIILGLIGMAGGILSLFLPETMNKELPQTLEDGEEFGKDQRFWDMPFRARKDN